MVIRILGMTPRAFATVALALTATAVLLIALFGPIFEWVEATAAFVAVATIIAVLGMLWWAPTAFWYANLALTARDAKDLVDRRRR